MLGIKNWQTTAAGVASLVALAAKVLAGNALDMDDIGVITVAIGLLRAKDQNVSHAPNPLPRAERAKP